MARDVQARQNGGTGPSLRVLCHELHLTHIPFQQVLSNEFLNLDFPPLRKFIKHSSFNQKQKFLHHFAQNYSKICLVSKTIFGV